MDKKRGNNQLSSSADFKPVSNLKPIPTVDSAFKSSQFVKFRSSSGQKSSSDQTKSSSNKTLRLPPESKKKFKSGDGKNHPVLGEELTLGQRAADVITTFGGSWTFIIIFFSFLIAWMAFNTWFLLRKPFDPFPFILLNLVLSCLAAVQAPIILMSQNRQAQRDRINARYDYLVNRKAEREIQMIMKEVEEVKKTLKVFNRR